MRLEGKVAIITGAASGIGLATVRRFHEEGAKVLIADLDGAAAGEAAQELDPSGSDVIHASCDVSKPADCAAAVEKAVSAFGGIDVLHANAGLPFTGEVETVDAETFHAVVSVNLGGAFFSAQAVIPFMKERGAGCIIFTSSLQGLIARPNFSPYTAAKHGVTGLMKGLALELAPSGIRVNAIAPGPTQTPMLGKFLGGMADDLDEAMERFKNSVPMGRLLEPIDVANAALFLASDEARMITGHTLVVDGGTTAG